MLTLAVFCALLFPALVVGYRAYAAGKRFAWARRSWGRLAMAAVLIYLTWGALDTLLKNTFGMAAGLAFDGMAAIIYCALLPAVSGFALLVGYWAAVIHFSYRDRDWGRLRDLWRRDG